MQTSTISSHSNWKCLARISTHNSTADAIDVSSKLWWTDVCLLYVCVHMNWCCLSLTQRIYISILLLIVHIVLVGTFFIIATRNSESWLSCQQSLKIIIHTNRQRLAYVTKWNQFGNIKLKIRNCGLRINWNRNFVDRLL